MKLKIYDGTPTGERHLCNSCCNSVRMRQGNKERHFCHALPGPSAEIRGRVTECDRYCSNADREAMNEFQGRAWHLDQNEDGSFDWSTPADRSDGRVSIRSRRRVNRRNPAGPPPTTSVQ